MVKWEELTPATIHQIAWEVRDGEADPKDARELMLLFVECVDKKRVVPAELLEHLRDAFKSICDGGRSAESALGIVPRIGRPVADEDTRKAIAIHMLRLRLKGQGPLFSEDSAIEKFGWKRTVITQAWARYKAEAFVVLDVERLNRGTQWTPAQVARLNKIYSKASKATNELFQRRAGTNPRNSNE